MTTVEYPNIALVGKMGSGKSTCSDLLRERLSYERLSFAEPLKIGCGTRDDRALLQKVGQGVRDLFPDFWVNLAVHAMQKSIDHPFRDRELRLVCDDCRYLNEVTRLKGEGFVIVRVVAPREVRIARLIRAGRLQSEDQLNHVSEIELDGFAADYTIDNDEATPLDALVEDLTAIVNREAR